MNILLVDDDLFVRELLRDVLLSQGHFIFERENGQLALDYINSTIEGIDLIVSDINMPILNGVELAQSVRALGKSTPIILITAYASLKLIDIARKLNITVLGKPINFSLLKQHVNKVELC